MTAVKSELKISNIISVFEGEFNPGYIKGPQLGRRCDGFVYFVCGAADYIFDKYGFCAKQSNYFYLANKSRYNINVREKSKWICVDFNFNGASPNISEAFSVNPQTAKNTFSKLFSVWNRKLPYSEPESLSLLYGLYADAVKSTDKAYSKRSKQLSDISEYILEHYREPELTVKSIAELAGITEQHLRRLFSNSFNTSPIKYINGLRLERAKNMLLNSNYSIAEIAESSGFNDRYYFSRVFKNELGVTPTEYRNTIHC